MKKLMITTFAIACLSAYSVNINAQWMGNSNGGNHLITDPGTPLGMLPSPIDNVGIGTDPTQTVPDRLTVNGDIGYETSPNPGGVQRNIFGRSGEQSLNIFGHETSSDGASIKLFGNFPGAQGASSGFVEYSCSGSNTSFSPAHQFVVNNMGNISPLVEILQNGNTRVLGNILQVGNASVGNIEFATGTSSTYRHIRGNHVNSGLALQSTSSSNAWQTGSGIVMNGNGTSSGKGAIAFVTTSTQSVPADPYEPGFTFWKANSSGGWSEVLMQINKNGKVCIGDNTISHVGDYKLYVQGGILTAKLKVAVHGGGSWFDHVFEDDYTLRTLDEVETYIKTNKHLPDVPSAKEVVRDGIDVATMDATLLRKIEELTLYVIQQQKEIMQLKSQLNK